ncbi:MAG: YihY/virulence factor BrkB family protein [Chakrabartia sp.]
MGPQSPETPEARRQHPDAHPKRPGWAALCGPGSAPFEVARRVALGVYSDGFVHAGNLAYLTLLTVFPFFILMAAVTRLIGQPEENLALVGSMVATLPPGVAQLIEGAAREVLLARTGPLLWFGALVGLWTVSGFIETLRDILRRAYGTRYERPFWQYRLGGVLLAFGAAVLILAGLAAQLAATAIEEIVIHFLPAARPLLSMPVGWVSTSFAIFCGLFAVFWSLAPSAYRARRHPKWPGALATTLWWTAALALLPPTLSLFGGYALTYGSLAGVIIALLFFWIVGFGLVIGAHLNAALANPEPKEPRGERQINDEGKS